MLKIFKIFKKNAISPKELYKPVLGDMWMCSVRFRPWEESKHDFCIKKVGLSKAEATNEGIWVIADEKDPFDPYTKEGAHGYIDRLESYGCSWIGFFESKEAAEKCYNETMEKWISVIQGKLIK